MEPGEEIRIYVEKKEVNKNFINPFVSFGVIISLPSSFPFCPFLPLFTVREDNDDEKIRCFYVCLLYTRGIRYGNV